MTGSLLSRWTVSTIGLASKAFLNCGYCASVAVEGMDNLHAALNSEERGRGRGIITLSNHISTLDDPLVWGTLPASYYRQSQRTRWTLGASDIMFTNPLFSTFFRKGQVIETFRGNGIFQPAIDLATEKLNQGHWIHLFGEGKVNQPAQTPERDPTKLIRFKWGVGRITMEALEPPVIIPMWLTGFDKLMPEGRPFPTKFFPRPGAHLSVTFGTPISTDKILAALDTPVHREGVIGSAFPTDHGRLADPGRPHEEIRSGFVTERGWMKDAVKRDGTMETASDIARTRSALTALLQDEVEALGRASMSGSVQRC